PVDGEYVPIPLGFKVEAADFEEWFEKAPEPLDASRPLPLDALEAQTLLRRAAAAASDFGRYDVAIDWLKQAAARQPQEAHYALAAGLLSFRHAGELKGAAQRAALDRGVAWLDVAAAL